MSALMILFPYCRINDICFMVFTRFLAFICVNIINAICFDSTEKDDVPCDCLRAT